MSELVMLERGTEIALTDPPGHPSGSYESMIALGFGESESAWTDEADDLRGRAEAVGLKVDRRWSIETLREKVEQAEGR